MAKAAEEGSLKRSVVIIYELVLLFLRYSRLDLVLIARVDEDYWVVSGGMGGVSECP